jgi:hypothetical protein
MALSSDPSVTYNAQGNITAAGTSLAASASSAGATVDSSSNSLGSWLSVTVTFGTVAATAGVTASVYPAGDSTPHYDTTASWTFTVPAVGTSTQQTSILLPTGKYQVVVKNTDATNSVTYGITSNPIA